VEILSYLHLNGRRLVSLVVVAAIAAGVTAILLSDSSDTYEAEAVVFASRALPLDSTAIDLGPFVSDLETVLALEPTRQQVAEATGVPEADMLLTTQMSSDRSNLSVVAKQANPGQAEDVATEAARTGLRTLLDQEVARAQLGLEAAETQLLEARAELERFRGENTTYNPVAEYDIVFETLRSLQLQLLDPSFTEEDREDLSEREPGLDAELDRLTPLQQPYNDLVQAVTSAETSFSQATRQMRTTEAALAGADSGDFVIVTPAEQVSSRNTLVTGMVAAVIVVGLLSVALFAVVDARIGRTEGDVTADRTSTGGPGGPSTAGDVPTEPVPSVALRGGNEQAEGGGNEQAEAVPVSSWASLDEEKLAGQNGELQDVEANEPGFDEELTDLLNELLRHGSTNPDDIDGIETDDVYTDGVYSDAVDTTDIAPDDIHAVILGIGLDESDEDDSDDDDESAQSDDRHDDESAENAEWDEHAESAGADAADTNGAASDLSKDDESEGADRSRRNR
jgi:uncharacterized protein involved in exopolysaccharide biosynthesis